MKNSDDHGIFTTVIFQREGLSDPSVVNAVLSAIFLKRLGILNEDGNSTPKAGDITFNWDQNSQQNDADHIGIVEKLENDIIHTSQRQQ